MIGYQNPYLTAFIQTGVLQGSHQLCLVLLDHCMAKQPTIQETYQHAKLPVLRCRMFHL